MLVQRRKDLKEEQLKLEQLLMQNAFVETPEKADATLAPPQPEISVVASKTNAAGPKSKREQLQVSKKTVQPVNTEHMYKVEPKSDSLKFIE